MEGLLLSLGILVGLLLLGFTVGHLLEARHFGSIRTREQETKGFPTLTFVPSDWTMSDASLVQGSVVVSMDYWKRFLATIRGLVGGRVRSIEPMLDRGRREAILRMKEAAIAQGSSAVVNVRLETARLATKRGDNKGTAGVEVLAYGTAIRRA